MPAHPPHLPASLTSHTFRAGRRRRRPRFRFRAPVRPDPTRHVVARAQQRVRQMRAPCHPPDGVLVARQYGHGPLSRRAHVEGPDQPVDARRRDDGRAVFVPVVRQGFVGREGGSGRKFQLGRRELCGGRGCLGGVDGEGEDEVVRGGGGGAEVEEAEVGVAGYGGEKGGRVWGEGGGVGAGVDGEGVEGVGAGGVPL